MAEIAGAEFQAALFVGETPATGVVGAIAGDGTIKVLEAWDPVQGDVTHTAPAGSAGGGGTRRHLFDREVYVDSTGLGAYVNVRAWASITGKPTTVGGYGITDAITTAGGQTIAGSLTVSGSFFKATTAANADVNGLLIDRTVNTPSTWQIYMPAGSTDLRWYNAADRLKLSAAGLLTVTGAIATSSDAANDIGSGSFRFRAGFFSGAVTAGSATIAGLVTVNGSTANLLVASTSSNDAYIEMRGGAGTSKNWRIGKDILTGSAFEIQASTTNGGTTYTTSLLTLTGAGALIGVGALSGFTTGHFTGLVTGDAGILVTAGTIQLGGTTAAQAAISYSGTEVRAVLGDSSAYAPLHAASFKGEKDLATYSEPSAQVRAVGSTDPNKQVVMGINTTANVGFIQAVQFGTGNFELRLNPNGGTVTVGSSLQPVTDNASDLGTASFRWRTANVVAVVVNGADATQGNVSSSGTSQTPFAANRTEAVAALMGHVRILRNGTVKAFIGLDANDHFSIINAAGSTAILSLDNAGALSITSDFSMVSGKSIYLNALHNAALFESATNVVDIWSAGTRSMAWSGGGVYLTNIGTTASAANCFTDNTNSGLISRSTSSLRYKDVVDALTLDDARAMMRALHPFWYHSRGTSDLIDGKVDESRWFLGFAAEDAGALDVSRGALHTIDEVGEPNWFQYERLTAVHNVVLNDHDTRIAQLERENAELRARLAPAA